MIMIALMPTTPPYREWSVKAWLALPTIIVIPSQ
jgi:hypothetical protein